MQDGAMLVACLLHAFKPLAARIMTAQHAAPMLLTKLKVRLSPGCTSGLGGHWCL